MKTDNGKDFPTMASEWYRYHSKIYPAGMAPQQAIECQQAFYGGAWVMFELVSAAAAAWNDESVAAKVLEGLRKEAEKFHDQRLEQMKARN